MGLGDGISWTARNAVEGVQIFGGIGSGKSSGSGATLAKKYLEAGFGGLVLTVKPDELESSWIPYCKATNRLDDLVVIKPNGDYRFNFIAYELNRTGAGRGLVDNLVNILKTVIKASKSNSTRSNDEFWEDALDMLMFNVLDLCYFAYGGKISIDKILAVVNALPKEAKEYKADATRQQRNKGLPKHKHKPSTNAFFQAFERFEEYVGKSIARARKAYDKKNGAGQFNAVKARKKVKAWKHYVTLRTYFKNSFLPLAPKTKTTIEHMFKGVLFRLSRDPVYSLLCAPTYNITPEDCFKGKIIVLDLPVKEFDKIGRDAQILFKYIWQRAMERRSFKDHGAMPVFLWADEAQNFIHEHDIDYQATARSARVCTVYLTQNLPNYYAHMGGKDGEYQVKSFLGTMGTKIFHANADIETNKYASELFGQVFYQERGTSVQMTEKFGTSMTKSIKLKQAVRPEQFIALKTGGDINKKQVQAYIHKQGMPWAWRKVIKDQPQDFKQNHKKITFSQS